MVLGIRICRRDSGLRAPVRRIFYQDDIRKCVMKLFFMLTKEGYALYCPHVLQGDLTKCVMGEVSLKFSIDHVYAKEKTGEGRR